MRRLLLTIVGILALCAGASARAQADAAICPCRPLPAFFADADDRFVGAYDVQGMVTSFHRFDMTLRARGREFPVRLHQGTVIKPTGTSLAPSMVVNIAGYWQAGTFYANRIIVLRY